MMTCEQFQELVHELARDTGLEQNTIEAALAHAEACDSCDNLLRGAESLRDGLVALAARHAAEQAPPFVEAALLERIKRQRATSQHTRQRVWTGAALAIAAAAILAAFLAVHPDATRGSAAVGQQTIAANATDTTLVDEDLSTEANTADSFVPLSPAIDTSLLDEGTVVRVQLSDAALESLGLPSYETARRGPVIADLVVAHDGAPQAIRLVSW